MLSASLHEHAYGKNHDHDNNYDLDYILEHVSLSIGPARRPQHVFVADVRQQIPLAETQ